MPLGDQKRRRHELYSGYSLAAAIQELSKGLGPGRGKNLMSAACGLRDLSGLYLEKIQAVFARYPQVEAAVLFGSWAKVTARSGSDIDIALKGSGIHLQGLN
jgi:hypothetical protein